MSAPDENDDATDDAGGYGLLMPFVTVKSKGGPHDDASYVAGFEMGVLDTTLKAVAPFADNGLGIPFTIHSENRAQADLIAMKHGFTVQDVEWDDDLCDECATEGWAQIILHRDVSDGVDDEHQ